MYCTEALNELDWTTAREPLNPTYNIDTTLSAQFRRDERFANASMMHKGYVTVDASKVIPPALLRALNDQHMIRGEETLKHVEIGVIKELHRSKVETFMKWDAPMQLAHETAMWQDLMQQLDDEIGFFHREHTLANETVNLLQYHVDVRLIRDVDLSLSCTQHFEHDSDDLARSVVARLDRHLKTSMWQVDRSKPACYNRVQPHHSPFAFRVTIYFAVLSVANYQRPEYLTNTVATQLDLDVSVDDTQKPKRGDENVKLKRTIPNIPKEQLVSTSVGGANEPGEHTDDSIDDEAVVSALNAAIAALLENIKAEKLAAEKLAAEKLAAEKLAAAKRASIVPTIKNGDDSNGGGGGGGGGGNDDDDETTDEDDDESTRDDSGEWDDNAYPDDPLLPWENVKSFDPKMRNQIDSVIKSAQQKPKQLPKSDTPATNVATPASPAFSLSAVPPTPPARNVFSLSAVPENEEHGLGTNTTLQQTPSLALNPYEGLTGALMEQWALEENIGDNVDDDYAPRLERSVNLAQTIVSPLDSAFLQARLLNPKYSMFKLAYDTVHPLREWEWSVGKLSVQMDGYIARFPYLIPGLADHAREFIRSERKWSRNEGNTGGMGYGIINRVHECPIAFDVVFATYLVSFVMFPFTHGLALNLQKYGDPKISHEFLTSFLDIITKQPNSDPSVQRYLMQLFTELEFVHAELVAKKDPQRDGETYDGSIERLREAFNVPTGKMNALIDTANSAAANSSVVSDDGELLKAKLALVDMPYDIDIPPRTLVIAGSAHRHMRKEFAPPPYVPSLYDDATVSNEYTEISNIHQRFAYEHACRMLLRSRNLDQNTFCDGLLPSWVSMDDYRTAIDRDVRTNRNMHLRMEEYLRELQQKSASFANVTQEKRVGKQLCYTQSILNVLAFVFQPSRLSTLLSSHFDDRNTIAAVVLMQRACENAQNSPQDNAPAWWNTQEIVEYACRLQTMIRARKHAMKIIQSMFVFERMIHHLGEIASNNNAKNDIVFSRQLISILEQDRVNAEEDARQVERAGLPGLARWKYARHALEICQMVLCMAEKEAMDPANYSVWKMLRTPIMRDFTPVVWNYRDLFPTIDFLRDDLRSDQPNRMVDVPWADLQVTPQEEYSSKANPGGWLLSSNQRRAR